MCPIITLDVPLEKEEEGEGKEKGEQVLHREVLQCRILAVLLHNANFAFQRCFISISSKEVGLAINLPHSYDIIHIPQNGIRYLRTFLSVLRNIKFFKFYFPNNSLIW